MQPLISPILSSCKAVFARNLEGFYVNEGCVVFNAPRPLLGSQHPCVEWCHGRFYSEINLSDSIAEVFISRNVELDARVVLPVTDQEVVEMLLMDNDYANRYREYPFEEQLEMLIPNISKIQHLEYGQAVALLEAAKAVLSAAESDE